MFDDVLEGGCFLNALATGLDATWPIESELYAFARKLRSELSDVVGNDEAADALMRACTQHGRLYPGLARPVQGSVVSSERGDVTPIDDVNDYLGRSLSEFLLDVRSRRDVHRGRGKLETDYTGPRQ